MLSSNNTAAAAAFGATLSVALVLGFVLWKGSNKKNVLDKYSLPDVVLADMSNVREPHSNSAEDLLLVSKAITAHRDFPSLGVTFRDVFPIFRDPRSLRCLIRLLHSHLIQAGKVDVIVGLDSRGFLLGPVLAVMINASFVPVRKRGKLPGQCCRVEFQKEYGTDSFELQAGAIPAGAKCILFDDLLATGGSLLAAAELVSMSNAQVVEACVIIELEDLPGRARLMEQNIALWSLLVY